MPDVEDDADIGGADILDDAERLRQGRDDGAGVLADRLKAEFDAGLARRVGGGFQALDDHAAVGGRIAAGAPESTITPPA